MPVLVTVDPARTPKRWQFQVTAAPALAVDWLATSTAPATASAAIRPAKNN